MGEVSWPPGPFALRRTDILQVNLPSPSSVYWDYAMTIRLEEIVYLHCHQQGRGCGGERRAGVLHPDPLPAPTLLLPVQPQPSFPSVGVIQHLLMG